MLISISNTVKVACTCARFQVCGTSHSLRRKSLADSLAPIFIKEFRPFIKLWFTPYRGIDKQLFYCKY